MKFKKLGGNPFSRWFLLLFLMLGNVTAWAQNDAIELSSLPFGNPDLEENFDGLKVETNTGKISPTETYAKHGIFNYFYSNKENTSYGITEDNPFNSKGLALTPEATSPLIAAITQKTFGDCGVFSFKTTKDSKMYIGLYSKMENNAVNHANASAYVHCSNGEISISGGKKWQAVKTVDTEIIDVCVIYNNTTTDEVYGNGIRLESKTAHVYVNGVCTMAEDGTTPKAFTIPGSSLVAFRIVAAESVVAQVDDVKIYNSLPVSNDPVINAEDITYDADLDGGKIAYTITNPVQGRLLTANTSDSWITLGEVADSEVPFITGKNETNDPRIGSITLTYEGAKDKVVKVTQKAATAKRMVTIETPENGTLKMYRGDEEVISGSLIPEGTELTAVPTPNEGYKFRNWQAVDASTHTYTSNFTYTIGKSNVTFKANFDEKVKYTITFADDETTLTENVAGEGVTLPTRDDVSPYNFMGWTTTDLTIEDTKEPTILSGVYVPESNITLYPVYVRTGEGVKEVTAETTIKEYATKNNWITTNQYNSLTLNSDITLSAQGTTNTGKYYDTNYSWRFYQSENATLTISAKEGATLTSVTLTYTKGGMKYGEKTMTSGKALSVTGTSVTLTATDTPQITNISVTYIVNGIVSYYTSHPVTIATITINAACTDGELVYGTFSSNRAFVVSDDIIVSEIGVENNKLKVQSYESGDIVPANTGVMVSALEGGDYTVELSDEAGTSVMGEANLLRATGDEGITAEQMAVQNANCKFYRLTMHMGETIGYFWGAAEGAAFNLAANKAYLAVPVDVVANIQGFTFESGDTDGIKGVETGNNVDSKVYNLQGQRVAQPTAKGVYITNGRKFIVK